MESTKDRVALVTGATGLLGSWLSYLLLSRGYRRIYALVRKDGNLLHERISEISKLLENGNPGQLGHTRIRVLYGDVSKPNLGLLSSSGIVRELKENVTDVFHAAAVTDLSASVDELRGPNTVGTRNVLDFALTVKTKKISSSHGMRVHYVSSVTVAGSRVGSFSEGQFDCPRYFNNGYEQSKFEAEQLALKYRTKGLAVSIYRPGIITGNSINGATVNFKMIYQPLRFLAHNLFQEWPANENTLISLVPVDKVAEAICLLAEVPQDYNHTWLLANPHDTSLRMLVDVGTQVFECRRPTLIPIEKFDAKDLSPKQWKLMEPFVPYLNYEVHFQAPLTNETLGKRGFQWPRIDRSMLEKLYRHCGNAGFIRAKLLRQRHRMVLVAPLRTLRK